MVRGERNRTQRDMKVTLLLSTSGLGESAGTPGSVQLLLVGEGGEGGETKGGRGGGELREDQKEKKGSRSGKNKLVEKLKFWVFGEASNCSIRPLRR